jgi:methyl-accepting chemotaxis protein
MVFLLISLVPLAVVSVLDTNNIYGKVTTNLNEQLDILGHNIGHQASEKFEAVETTVENIVTNPITIRNAVNATSLSMDVLWDSYEGANYDNDENMKNNKTAITYDPTNDIDPDFSKYLDDVAKEQNFAEIFVTDARGYVFASTTSVPGDFLQKDEGWWTACLANDDMFVEIGYDDSTNAYLVDIVMAIRSGSTFVGMIKAGFLTDEMGEDMFNAIEIEGISAMMIGSDGNIVFHTDATKIGTAASLLLPVSNKGNQDLLTEITTDRNTEHNQIKINMDGKSYFAVFEHVVDHGGHDWESTVLVFRAESFVDNVVYQQIFGSVLLAAVITAIVVVFAVFFGSTLAQPITQIAKISKSVSDGDLTIDLDEINTTRGDEIGEMGQAFSTMVSSLRNIITTVSDTSERIASSSEELASTSEEVNALTEEIAATIQQISRGSTSQSDLSAKSIEDVNQMSKVVDESLSDIENTLKVIEDVAGQTNILALNAAIEAARAGEYGRGFAVVADNVRRLAEETRKNSSDINLMTDTIVQNVGGSVRGLQDTLQGFAAQSEEFSASSEEVAAATEEQTAAMHEMTSSAQELSRMAEELSSIISQYKTAASEQTRKLQEMMAKEE